MFGRKRKERKNSNVEADVEMTKKTSCCGSCKKSGEKCCGSKSSTRNTTKACK